MTPQQLIPGAIAAVGAALCQVHGGPFWVGLMGSVWIGWTLSGVWEAMSIWMWWEGSYRSLKYVPTAFLLFGMIYQSGAPVLETIERARNTSEIQERAQATVDDMRELIVKQKRRGWQHMLEKALAVTMLQGSDTATPVLYVTSVVPLIGFPVMYGLCLVLVGRLRGGVPKRSDPTEQLAERCKTAIEAMLAGGMTYRKLRDELGISASVLNGVVHRERLQNNGEHVPQLKALEKCALALGVE